MTRRRTDDEFRSSFWSKVDQRGACWLWKGTMTQKGYGSFFARLNERTYWRAHRYCWALLKGPIPSGMQICHSCDNRWCVNPEHLYVGTNQDNVNDRNQRGRTALGERARHAKLTEPQVIEIKLSDKPDALLARQYEVDQSAITKIRNGDNWKHVQVDTGDRGQ